MTAQQAFTLARQHQQAGRLREAEDLYRRILQAEPNSAEAHHRLGIALAGQGRYSGAATAWRRALELQPDSLEALGNLGNALKLQGQFEEALACYRRAIACHPDSAKAHFNLGILLLLLGRYGEGWREYEWRWKTPVHASHARPFSAPLWDGQPVAGKTILIHTEQGFGDTLQFLRYLPVARAHSRAAHFILECHPALIPLLHQLRRADIEIIACGNVGKKLPPYDLHLPLLSLPLALQRFAPEPVNGPYLQADRKLRAQWREQLIPGGGFCVGLAWAGRTSHADDRCRSIAPEILAPLLRIPTIRFVSLQVEPRNALPPPLAAAGVSDFTADIASFADSAALIAELDLVITVDTATAHLAGALGHPVWVLLPFVPDWRWGLGREDTPWYPTMRLFRQSSAGHWDQVVERIGDELRQRCVPKV